MRQIIQRILAQCLAQSVRSKIKFASVATPVTNINKMYYFIKKKIKVSFSSSKPFQDQDHVLNNSAITYSNLFAAGMSTAPLRGW